MYSDSDNVILFCPAPLRPSRWLYTVASARLDDGVLPAALPLPHS